MTLLILAAVIVAAATASAIATRRAHREHALTWGRVQYRLTFPTNPNA